MNSDTGTIPTNNTNNVLLEQAKQQLLVCINHVSFI